MNPAVAARPAVIAGVPSKYQASYELAVLASGWQARVIKKYGHPRNFRLKKALAASLSFLYRCRMIKIRIRKRGNFGTDD